MPNVSLHTTKAMASAIAKEAIARNSSVRVIGGAMLDHQIKNVPILSLMASAAEKVANNTKRLGRHRQLIRRVLQIVAAETDENHWRWKSLQAELNATQSALDAANQAIAAEVSPGSRSLAEMHALAAAAVARIRGPGMADEQLSDNKLKLARLAIATGAIAHPMRSKPDLKL